MAPDIRNALALERHRDADLKRQRGVAAREHQPELVIAQRPSLHLRILLAGTSCHLGEHLGVNGERAVTAQLVDGLAPRGHGQPAAGIGRDAIKRPGPRSRRERLGGGVLGYLQVTQPPGQGRPFFPEGTLQAGHAHRRLTRRIAA
jgi:hypothetical protein